MFNKLVKIKKSLKRKGERGLALDIDGTLSCTTRCWFEQLQIKFGSPEGFSIEEIVTKYTYAENVPFWQTKEAFVWMEESRNSDKLQETLPLIENSNFIVQKINKIIPIVAYITTRPQLVIQGTKKWLKKHNFPQKEIIAKPVKISHREGNKWKAKVLEMLYPQIVGIIDDNLGLVESLSSKYKGTIYLYNNPYCERQDINVIPCKTWNDVLSQIEKAGVSK